jgi:UDP-glucose 4-epimerase
LPVSETHSAKPLSPYGFHKLQGELLCEEFAQVYGLGTASVRIFSAYGPGLRRQVIWDMCAKLLSPAREPILLYGTGRESRDFIHARDVARALLLLATSAPCKGERYNLGAGREVTIAELFQMLSRELGCRTEPIFSGESRPGDPLNWRADISRLKSLGFEPSVDLEQGLRTFAAWVTAELSGK